MGQKLVKEYLSSVCLSRVETHVIMWKQSLIETVINCNGAIVFLRLLQIALLVWVESYPYL